MRMADCVTDWGGFEKFVAELNRTGELVSVDHNVHPIGRSGLKRQIDVFVTHRVPPPYQEHRTIIDCKFWKSRVKRNDVDAMATAMQDLSASRGAFFTTKGFQTGALEMAKHSNVDLFLVRDLTDSEWGGRVLDFRLQSYERAIEKLPGIRAVGQILEGRNAPCFRLNFGGGEPTPLWHLDGTAAESLESRIDQATQEAMVRLVSLQRGQFSATVEDHLYPTTASIVFDSPILWKDPADDLPSFVLQQFDLPFFVKVRQEVFSVDRSKQFPIALAVVDCVNDKSYFASRGTNDPVVRYDALPKSSIPKSPPPTYFDIQIFLRPWTPVLAEVSGPPGS